LASLDKSLKQRNIKGAAHGAKADIAIWNEFNGNWDKLAFESEQLLRKLGSEGLPEPLLVFPSGESRLAQVKVRINQTFFRAAVLSAYESTCCISGLNVPSLLIASHIVPWACDATCRTNPRNGLCLSAIHDRAYDCGLITVTPDHTLRVSARLKNKPTPSLHAMLLRFEGCRIKLPQKFPPDQNFLRFHSENIFQP
jgi:putative restriction endonuclease